MRKLLHVVAGLADVAVAGGGAGVEPVQRRRLAVAAGELAAERSQVVGQGAVDPGQRLDLGQTGAAGLQQQHVQRRPQFVGGLHLDLDAEVADGAWRRVQP